MWHGLPFFFCVLHATFVSRIGMDVLRVLPFQVAFFGGHVFFFSLRLLLQQYFFCNPNHFFFNPYIFFVWTKFRAPSTCFYQNLLLIKPFFSIATPFSVQAFIVSIIDIIVHFFLHVFSNNVFFHRTLLFFLSQIKHWITVFRSIGINFLCHGVFLLQSFFVSFHQRHLCNQNTLISLNTFSILIIYVSINFFYHGFA